MANGTAPLPSWLVAPRVSARSWLAAAAGLGCAATAYAGLYPQFDDGELRFIIALTAAPFGAAVVATAVGARTAPRAFGRAVFYAGLLGVASTILPAAILSHERFAEFPLLCVFGLFFGAPTGMIYGLPLGVLAALGHRHVGTPTHAAKDGASRIAGAWLCAAGLFALLGAVALGGSVLPTIAASTAASVGLVVLARGSVRVRRRSAWLGRVRAGLE
ncbi:MAG TPA: hypothetical protein VLT33_08530, partial [Labilithrix sp.]|nr:hypothetical protein [Labilithrix sp.]